MNRIPTIDDRATADRLSARARAIPRTAFRELEDALSDTPFLGIPLGGTLSDHFVTAFIDGSGDWRRSTKWLRRLLVRRHRTLPRVHRRAGTAFPPGRVLVTWSIPSHRYDRLLLPILERLGPDECAVTYGDDGVAPLVPTGIPHFAAHDAMDFEVEAWRREYERCRPSWERTIREVCGRYAFPDGSFELLSFELMIASQQVMGWLEFLGAHRPSAILTEYDRNRLWSCLVLAARKLGIPSLTLVHGVIERDAFGFSPVLADRILCWGELDRAKLIDVGEAPSKVLVAGCPRLTRDLRHPSPEVRRRLGIDRDGPVAMLATSPEHTRFTLAEAFSTAIERLPELSGVVRLHPSEDLTEYEGLITRHPAISFVENSRASMDDALAASDVVVVRASGTGSDALVKRKLVVVLSPDLRPTGHDQELIELAGCPHAHDADELTAVLERLTQDPAARAERATAAERFVERFCAAFGDEAADITTAAVRAAAGAGRSVDAAGLDDPGNVTTSPGA